MEKRLVGVKELAEYLDLSVNTLYSWVWKRKIPSYKLGGGVFKFDLSEIDQWLRKCKKEPNSKWEVVIGDIPEG